MIDPWEYVRSVEWALAVWVASALAVGVLTIRGLRRLRWVDLRAFARSEDGAAYSMSYAMAMPIYVFLCLLILETTMILLAKIGSVYAAYAAARNNIVYASLDSAELVPNAPRARRAAVRAMAPFGSADRDHADGPRTAAGEADARAYATAARRFASDLRYTQDAVRRGYLYADQATEVRIVRTGTEPNALVEASVTYRVPLRMPVAARILGKRSPHGGRYFVAEVRSTVRLPDESPRTPDRRLGIRYEPPR